MGRINQELWKQPPVSLNVEWPTDCTRRLGPTLEEQKARMRETRAKVANAIASSGQPVPNWPEVGQPVNWSSSRHASIGKGMVNTSSGFGGQASQLSSSRIPLRYQTSTPAPNIRSPFRLGRDIARKTPSSLQGSPLSRFPNRPRSKSHQPEDISPPMNLMSSARTYLKPKSHEPYTASASQNGLPVGIDPSIFNPRIFIVELPEPIFRRTPPIAPRAMLEQMSSISAPRQVGRARMGSEATATASHRSYETTQTRARGYSSTTMGSQQSFEPTGNECTEPSESFETALAHTAPQIPPRVVQEYSSAAVNMATHQGRDTAYYEFDNDSKPARQIPPPPGFEFYHASRAIQRIPPPPGFENSIPDFDAATGTWSYSKIWVSEEERLRINFARMQENAHHTSLDRSPFFPQTPSEYAALLAEKKAAEAKRIRKRIQHSEETVQHHHDEVETETVRPNLPDVVPFLLMIVKLTGFVKTTQPQVQNMELLLGKKMKDGLSLVLAMESCFNEIPDTPETERVDWPPSSEFRNWKASRPPSGKTRRSDSHRGAWPFPRLNMPCKSDKSDDISDNGEIPYSKRKMVFAPRWDWAPRFVRMTDEEGHMPVSEISMTWLFVVNPILADLVQDIQRRPPQEPLDD